MGPTGSIIKGHVLDVSEAKFTQTMRFTLNDPFLYVRWNPKKMRGYGAWEIRRRPEFNSALDLAEFEGNLIFNVGPKEYDLVHHVLDCAFLNYDAIRKLKEMDMLGTYSTSSKYLDEVDRRTRDRKERERQNALNEKRAMVKYFKKEIRQFRDAVLDGVNPHTIARHWDSAKEAE